jgi:hypothetical protein
MTYTAAKKAPISVAPMVLPSVTAPEDMVATETEWIDPTSFYSGVGIHHMPTLITLFQKRTLNISLIRQLEIGGVAPTSKIPTRATSCFRS